MRVSAVRVCLPDLDSTPTKRVDRRRLTGSWRTHHAARHEHLVSAEAELAAIDRGRGDEATSRNHRQSPLRRYRHDRALLPYALEPKKSGRIVVEDVSLLLCGQVVGLLDRCDRPVTLLGPSHLVGATHQAVRETGANEGLEVPVKRGAQIIDYRTARIGKTILQVLLAK
jgi:hypothetical protein